MSDRPGFRFIVIALANLALFPSIALAQSDGAPVPPAVATQDDSGRVSLRAVRLDRPLEIDGQLDEPIYSARPPIDHFVQQVPKEGAPASEKTEAWIFFDDDELLFLRTVPRQSARAHCRQRAPSRQLQHLQRWRQHHARSRYVLRSAERRALPDQPARRPPRTGDCRRRLHRKLEHRLAGAFRGIEDGWSTEMVDPVQVAALPRERTADLGHQLPTRDPLEERVLRRHADAGVVRPVGSCADAGRRRRCTASRRPRGRATSSSSPTSCRP